MHTALLVAPAGFAAFVVAHAALFHWRLFRRRSAVILALFLVTTALVAGTLLIRSGVVASVYGIVMMASAFVVYMPFYYTIDTSVSVRTMLELEASPGGLTREELVERYRLEWMVDRRLDTMVENGYLTRQSGGFALTPRGLQVAHVFRMIKKVANLGAGG